MDIKQQLGKRIKELRLKNGLSQEVCRVQFFAPNFKFKTFINTLFSPKTLSPTARQFIQEMDKGENKKSLKLITLRIFMVGVERLELPTSSL